MTTVHNLSVKDGALTMSRELLDPSALSICLMNPEVNLKAPPRAPGLLRMALEMRFPMELGIGLTSLPFLMTATGGDGHCVIVIPGLAASDDSTGPLRYYLRHLGYDALCGVPTPSSCDSASTHVEYSRNLIARRRVRLPIERREDHGRSERLARG